MDFYTVCSKQVINYLNSDAVNGLNQTNLKINTEKYGYNRLSEKKKKAYPLSGIRLDHFAVSRLLPKTKNRW